MNIVPILLTVLSLILYINWLSTATEFSFTLWVFGFVCGITVVSWINYLLKE